MLLEWKCVLQFYSMWKVWVVCKEEKCSVVYQKPNKKLKLCMRNVVKQKFLEQCQAKKNSWKKQGKIFFCKINLYLKQ